MNGNQGLGCSGREVVAGAAAEARSASRIDVGWRNERHSAADPDSLYTYLPPVVVNVMVTRLAEEHPFARSVGPASLAHHRM